MSTKTLKSPHPLHERIGGSNPSKALFPDIFEALTHSPDLLARAELALEAALLSGAAIWNGRLSTSFEVANKGLRDFVTSVDTQAQSIIIDTLSNQFHSDHFLAEEEDPRAQSTDYHKPTWIIDPLDGTTNFIRGHAHCSTSIGFAVEGRLTIGVVYAPFLDRIFLAVRGFGAYQQSGKLKVSNVTTLSECLVATGFPYNRDNVEHLTARVRTLLTNCADIRRNGAASLDLCHVACGLLDAYIESVAPWDMAAGLLIALEAGGAYTTLGTPASPIEFLNSTNLLVGSPQAVELLKSIL